MTDATEPSPNDPAHPTPEAATQPATASQDLTPPAPKLIIPATIVAIIACILFLVFANGSDDVDAPENEPAVTVDGDAETGVDVESKDGLNIEAGDGAVSVDVPGKVDIDIDGND